MMKKVLFSVLLFSFFFLLGCSHNEPFDEDNCLISQISIKDSLFLDYQNGTLYEYPGYRLSDEIPVQSGEEYIFTLHNSALGIVYEGSAIFGAFFNNNQYVSGFYCSSCYCNSCSVTNGEIFLSCPNKANTLLISVNDEYDKLIWQLRKKETDIMYTDVEYPLNSKNIVFFGDSIIGNYRDYTSVSSKVSKLTGATTFNCGFGSCRMSKNQTNWDYCSMVSIAECVENDDFHEVNDAIESSWHGMPGYFTTTIRELSSQIDFNSVDMVVISYGTNDYKDNVSILAPSPDSGIESEYSVCGALLMAIQSLKNRYPALRILVTSPIYRFFYDTDFTVIDDSNTHDWGSGTLIDYVNAFRIVCDEQNVEYLDLYTDSVINEDTRMSFFEEKDGVHPNEKGRQQIAQAVSEKILNMFNAD